MAGCPRESATASRSASAPPWPRRPAPRGASSAAVRPTATGWPTPGRTPTRARRQWGQRLHRLEPDPDAAPVVRRIFDEYAAGRGLYAIAEGLTRDGIPSPSAHDPARNRHRDTRAWS